MKSIISLLLLAVFMLNCEEKAQTINHDETVITEIKKDSSKIEIADLPILIDSTDYLIHPIGYITDYKSKFSSYRDKSNYTSFSVSNYNEFSITGQFSNLKFQSLNSEELTSLTNETMVITSVHLLENVKTQTGRQFLLYKIRDADTNKDNALDFNDLESLYISTTDGKNFKKLAPDFAEIIEWKVILELNRMYLKSISDTNKNGKFDKNDKVNYQYVNLEDETLKVITYNPIKSL